LVGEAGVGVGVTVAVGEEVGDGLGVVDEAGAVVCAGGGALQAFNRTGPAIASNDSNETFFKKSRRSTLRLSGVSGVLSSGLV
jgi:hypothetical protein